MDGRVEKLYRAKIYSELPEPEKRKDQGVELKVKALDEKAVAKINVDSLLKTFANEVIHKSDETLPNPLNTLPDDIIQVIIELLIHQDTPSFVSFAMCCKRIAYLGFSTSHSWKILCNLVYPKQQYNPEVARLNGISTDQSKMVISYDHDWHRMYMERPFIKFNGIYISVVNYYREGGRADGSSSWTNPIRMITYYRYIRFYPDGSCLKLLTVEEPQHIVSKFSKNWRENGLQQKICHGWWNLTPDGQVSIDSEGSVDRYRFIENLQINNSGHRHKHNRLLWINYEFMDIETTERNEFDIKKEKPYIFSRVKSYIDG